MKFSRFKSLILKDLRNSIRNIELVAGVLSFNLLITILITFFYRSIKIDLEEVGIFCLPLVWTIFLITMVKLVLQLLSEESRKQIFLNQMRDGYSSSEIFFSKLVCVNCIGLIVSFVQIFAFTILLGFTESAKQMFLFYILCALSLPAVSSISIISAVISQRSSKEELLMPILTLPLLLFLSISVLNFSEIVFESGTLDYSNYWFKVIVAIQVIYVMLCNLLFSQVGKFRY